MAQNLSDMIGLSLLQKGFTLKCLSRCCFDMIARKGSSVLLIKSLSDANSVSEEHAVQMRNLSAYMGASPFIVAEKAGRTLVDYVVYTRHGIYAMSLSTFMNSVDNKLPYIFSTNAGLTAMISGSNLMEMLDETGMSAADLSRKIGVSRRMAAKYADGSQITVQKAEKIYELLGHTVFRKIDVFAQSDAAPSGRETLITRKYGELGFQAGEARKVPFNIIAKKDREIILTDLGDRANPDTRSLSMLLDADNLLISSRKQPRQSDIPSLSRKEFMEFEESNDLIKFLREF